MKLASPFVLFICAAVLLPALPNASAATPRAPVEVQVAMWESPIARPPIIRMSFRSNAREAVRFHVEWTENGAPRPLPEFPDFDCATGSAQAYQCLPLRVGTRSKFARPDSSYPFGALFKNLSFDANYCFRAVAEDDDREKSSWSPWACARTPSPPALPSAPLNVQITPLPGASGRGQVGGSVADRLLVEWDRLYGEIGWYAVELAPAVNSPIFKTGDNLRVPAGKSELAFNHDLAGNAVYVRVCAVNVAGKACSRHQMFPPRDLADNAKAETAARRGPKPPTAEDARAGPVVIAKPPPVTSTNARAGGASAIPPPKIDRPASSFDRNSGLR